MQCRSLEEVREFIDATDHQIVALLAQRARFVQQAARFKKDPSAVRAPDRVRQVLDRVRGMAQRHALNPDIVEATYRAMIEGFIQTELTEHARLNALGAKE